MATQKKAAAKKKPGKKKLSKSAQESAKVKSMLLRDGARLPHGYEVVIRKKKPAKKNRKK